MEQQPRRVFMSPRLCAVKALSRIEPHTRVMKAGLEMQTVPFFSILSKSIPLFEISGVPEATREHIDWVWHSETPYVRCNASV